MKGSFGQTKPNTYATFVDPFSGSSSTVQDFAYKKGNGAPGNSKYNTHATFIMEEPKPSRGFAVKEQGGGFNGGHQKGGSSFSIVFSLKIQLALGFSQED